MRVSYWDNWKGIAIIAVVAIHASGNTGNFQEGSFNWAFGLTIRQIIDFAVPMFLAMSGYFSVKNSDGNPIQYYKGRFSKLIVPYLAWTAFYIALKTPTIPPSFSEILKGVFFGTGIGIGYFVIVLSQFIILTPLLSRIEKKEHHIAIIIAMSALGSIFTYSFFATNPEHILSKFPANGLPFFVWYPFYHSGYFLARYKNDIKLSEANKSKLACGVLFFLTLSLLEGFFWATNNNYSFGTSQLKITSFATSLLLFIMAISLANKETPLSRPSIVSWLGENSYAIYLTHMLTLIASQKILKTSETLYSIQPLFITLSTILSIIACAILISATKKILPAALSKNITGN